MNRYRVIVNLKINPGFPIVMDHINDEELRAFAEQRESDQLFVKLGNRLIKNRLINDFEFVAKVS
jgi:hypothetical protein